MGIKTIHKHLFMLLFTMTITLQGGVFAQNNISIKTKLDTTEFLIGDQVGLQLSIKQSQNEFVRMPVFNEALTEQIEIIEQSENDTLSLENGEWLIKKQFLITVFDSGYYAIPPIPVTYQADTLFSEPLLFKVNAVAVDTTQAIKDIKMPYQAPVSFKEVMPWAVGGLGLVLIIFVLIYIIRKIKRKEPIIKRFKPKEPAHIIAYKDLSKLKDERLWQQDKIKDYYTNLTDILRMYLWNRYEVKTLERTSDEILDSLKTINFDNQEAFQTLKEIFYTSDLVKFAKFNPVIDEHEKCISGAYLFVDKTKLIVEDKKEELEEIPQENNNEKISVNKEK